MKAEKNKYPKFSIKTTCVDVSRLTRKKSEANEFIEVFFMMAENMAFDLSCIMALFLVKKMFFMF